jgi:hypothetical protein
MNQGATHKIQNKLTGFFRSSRIPLRVRDLFTQSAGGIPNICNFTKQTQNRSATAQAVRYENAKQTQFSLFSD